MNYIIKSSNYLIENLDLKKPLLKETRRGFADALIELGDENPDIVVIGGDVSPSVRTDLFRDKFPDRFFSVGIAEQNMMGVAAGLAVVGKIPIASTYGEFATGRPFDQIRQSIAYSEMNVKICASHCGLTVGPDGATHQSLEDVALMRILPHMNVITPCDYNQTYRSVKKSVEIKEPFYIRFYRDNSPNFTNPDSPFEFGKADILVDGTQCTVMASGLLVWESLLVADELKSVGIDVRVVNMHTIKPIDKEMIIKCAKETGCIVSAEDHQINGGLGSAIAEVLVQEYPVPMELIGVKDSFGESGKGSELMEKYGLSSKHIINAIKKVIKRKNQK